MILQGTPEWHAQRLGKLTASRVADIIAKTKSGYSTSRRNYAVELANERFTGQHQEFFCNDAMRWGTETEPAARSAYEMKSGNLVTEVALIDHPRIAWSGASPDGLIDADGLIEIKCPTTPTHLDTLLCKQVPTKYLTQMQWQLACTERAWCDFVSFDPRVDSRIKLFVTRVPRDDKYIAMLEAEAVSFLAEVQSLMDQFNQLVKEAA